MSITFKSHASRGKLSVYVKALGLVAFHQVLQDSQSMLNTAAYLRAPDHDTLTKNEYFRVTFPQLPPEAPYLLESGTVLSSLLVFMQQVCGTSGANSLCWLNSRAQEGWIHMVLGLIFHSCFAGHLGFYYALLDFFQRCSFRSCSSMIAVWIQCTILGIQSSFFFLGESPFLLQPNFLAALVAIPENEEQHCVSK